MWADKLGQADKMAKAKAAAAARRAAIEAELRAQMRVAQRTENYIRRFALYQLHRPGR